MERRKKVKVPLYKPSEHTEGVEVQLHSFLTSTLDGGEHEGKE
jgi:hypothetical protein